MVVYRINSQSLHHLIKKLRSGALEKCVRLTLISDSVYYIVSFIVFVHHLVNGIDIILKIGIHGNDHIGIFLSDHKPCKQRVLMTAVPAQVYAVKQPVLIMQRLDYAPRGIPGAIVDKHHLAFR